MAGDDRLSYETFGHGPAVIILAGGPGMDPAYMRPVAKAVAQDGFEAVLLDQRGTGASPIGSPERVSVGGAVADVEALREAIRSERIVVLGHSFGGAIAQAYAAAHPEYVARLVLLDSVGPNLRLVSEPVDRWRARLTPAEVGQYDHLRALGQEESAARLKFEGSFDDRKAGEAFAAGLQTGWLNPLVFSQMNAAFEVGYDVTQQPFSGLFRVYAVSGADDWMRGYEPVLKAYYPNLKTRVAPHAGHFPWIEQPQPTWAALRWALLDR